jgi:hypothetical protein
MTYTRTASDGSVTRHDYLYQLDQITKAPTGEIEFVGTHFPIDSGGRSMVALDVIAAQTQNHTYTAIRTGLECDDDSAGDRATDTSVPAEVGQAIGPGDPPNPPPDAPPLPPVPTPPGGGNPPSEPPPPGGYPPVPGVPASPVPTPPDDLKPDPCASTCTSRIVCGTSPVCAAGETNVGTITAHGPDGDETCIICESCVNSNDPDCYPLPPDCCSPAETAAGWFCSLYVDLLFVFSNGRLHQVRTKDGSYSTSYAGPNLRIDFKNVCNQDTVDFVLFVEGIAYEVQRQPSSGFFIGCFPPCT